MAAKDIFISHSSKDNEVALKIASVLTNNKITYWLDLNDIPADGGTFAGHITQGLEQAKIFLLILSCDLQGIVLGRTVIDDKYLHIVSPREQGFDRLGHVSCRVITGNGYRKKFHFFTDRPCGHLLDPSDTEAPSS